MLHIFTFGSDANRLQYLKQTEKNHNNNIHYIVTDRWNGYIDQLEYMKRAIDDIPPDDIICFIDGYDVLVNSDNEDILNKFKSYDCDFLIGAELNCYPEYYKTRMDGINQNTDNFYKYINSGGYIGYNKTIKHMLCWKPESEIERICKIEGDQSYVIEYYLENYNTQKICLDIYCKIFQNMHWVSWDSFIFKYGTIYNTVMDSDPCFIHFNGGTWQTNSRENIMPVFCKKIEDSKTTNDELTLNEYRQIITSTCFPHPQK